MGGDFEERIGWKRNPKIRPWKTVFEAHLPIAF